MTNEIGKPTIIDRPPSRSVAVGNHDHVATVEPLRVCRLPIGGAGNRVAESDPGRAQRERVRLALDQYDRTLGVERRLGRGKRSRDEPESASDFACAPRKRDGR